MDTTAAPSTARWGPRLCALSPIVAAASFGIGLLDSQGGENPLAALALLTAFVGAACGLVGLFRTLLAAERATGSVRPRWALPCAAVGIAASFSAGLFGLIT